MKKAFLTAVMLVIFLATLQPVFAHPVAQNIISLDKFVSSIKYNAQKNEWEDNFDKVVSFPDYYIKGIQLSWHSDDTVTVTATLGSQFDTSRKSFPATSGKKVSVDRFKIFLELTPTAIPFAKVPALLKKYEAILKSHPSSYEITAKLVSYQWGWKGKKEFQKRSPQMEYLWLFFFIQSPTEQELEKLSKDVYFIASVEELNLALQQKDVLRGLAISGTFYQGLTATEQKRVEELVQNTLSRKYRPVFIYGQGLDVGLAKKLLNKDVSGCTPSIFGGIMPTERADRSETVINMCGADDKERSEEWLRNFISKYWKETKEDLQNRGTTVLK